MLCLFSDIVDELLSEVYVLYAGRNAHSANKLHLLQFFSNLLLKENIVSSKWAILHYIFLVGYSRIDDYLNTLSRWPA